MRMVDVFSLVLLTGCPDRGPPEQGLAGSCTESAHCQEGLQCSTESACVGPFVIEVKVEDIVDQTRPFTITLLPAERYDAWAGIDEFDPDEARVKVVLSPSEYVPSSLVTVPGAPVGLVDIMIFQVLDPAAWSEPVVYGLRELRVDERGRYTTVDIPSDPYTTLIVSMYDSAKLL